MLLLGCQGEIPLIFSIFYIPAPMTKCTRFFSKKSVSEWFSIKNLTKEISQMDKIGFIETKEHIACKINKLELDQMIFWWKFNFFKNIIKKCHKNTEFVKKK